MTEKSSKQHVVLCEGFEDRDFWAGWLKHLGCSDPTDRGKKTGKDAWGRPVRGKGRYLFRTPAGSSVVVHPFEGRGNARKAVGDYLRGEANRPDRLVINLDSDAENGSQAEGAREAIRQILRHYGGEPAGGSTGPFQLGAVRIFPVIWECYDSETTAGVPRKQTLERLVTAAIQAAEPDRGLAVDGWLAAEPRAEAEATTVKSYSYSYYAKWYGKHGVGDFLQTVWRDEAVAGQLRERLEKTGSWETVVDLVAD